MTGLVSICSCPSSRWICSIGMPLSIAAAKDGVGSAEHRETERQIAENALTLVKNENGAFPLQVKPGEKTLILFADSCASRAGTGDLARQLLAYWGSTMRELPAEANAAKAKFWFFAPEHVIIVRV